MRSRAYPSAILALCAVVLIGIGLYFMLLRPPLLPEDVRYIGATSEEVGAVAPGFAVWITRVFWVLGGYIIATGLLTLTIALSSFREHSLRLSAVVAIAGLSSIGWMAVVNFLIDSDYKWPLLGVAVLWLAAVTIAWIQSAANRRKEVTR
jgi:hypothetical protein